MCRKWETVRALGGHNPEKLWGRQLPAKQWKYTNIKWDRYPANSSDLAVD